MPPKRRIKVPDHTITDLSAYLAQVDAQLAAEGTASGSTDGSYSTSRSLSPSGYGGNVLPPDPSSPRVRMVEEFMKKTEQGGDWLQQWYAENYEKVDHYEYMRFELLYFLSDYMPGIKVNEDIHPHNLVEMVKELITDLSTKFNKFNLELLEIQGHEIAGHIQNHHRKVIEVVDDYENKIKSANEEIAQCKEHIAHLDAELSAALAKIMYFQGGTSFYEESVSEEQFMADLEGRVARAEKMSSTMKEDLQRERQQLEEMQQRVAQLSREKVETEEQCMKEIVELSQRSEINSMLERGIESMLQREDKAPNSEDCQRLIDQWKDEINNAIDQNSKEIDELMKKVESQNKDMAELQAKAKQQDDQIEKIQTKIKNARSLYDKYKEEASELKAQIEEIKKIIEDLNNESMGLEARYGDIPEGEDDIDINWSLHGEIPEHEFLADTLPLRGRRRRRRPATPLSTESSQGSSSPDQPSLPMGGLGVIRIGEDDEWEAVGGGRAPISSGEETSYRIPAPPTRQHVRYVTHRGRVFAVPVDEAPESQSEQSTARPEQAGSGAGTPSFRFVTRAGRVHQVPVEEPPRSPSAPSPISPEQSVCATENPPVLYTTQAGRVTPLVQEPTPREPAQLGAMRFVDGQWMPVGRRSPSPPLTQEPTPREPAQLGAMRFVDGQWVPVGRRSPSPPLTQEPTPREPAQLGAMRFVDGQWVPVGRRSPSPPLHSTLRNQTHIPSPRAPARLEVSRIPTGRTPTRSGASRIPMGRTPTRQGIPSATLTTPRVGTLRGLGAAGMGRPSPRATPRGPAGMRPVAQRPGTPPRPRMTPAQRTPAQRTRGTPTTPAAGRSRTPQRRGIPAVTTPAPDRLSSRVMLLSPQRPEPLALDVDVVPQNIVSTGNQIVCEVAVGIQPAATPNSAGRNASRGGRGRRARPPFTPRTGFQR